MFVPQEDHFPAEFQNVYLIELLSQVSNLPYKIGDTFEVIGHNFDSFTWGKKKEEIKIPKSKARIIKKMIRAVK